MPAAQVPLTFIEGFTAKVYSRCRRAERSVRCSDWLGGCSLLAPFYQAIVGPVVSDPEPRQLVPVANRQRAIVQADAH